MERLNVIFLSSILNRQVIDEFDETIGVLKDLYVDTKNGYPKVIGYMLDKGGDIYNYEFKEIEFYEDNKDKVYIETKGSRDIIPQRFSFLVSKDILNRDIIDSTGKVSFKVYDVRLAQLDDGLHLIAVDKAKPTSSFLNNSMFRIFNKKSKSKEDSLILWDDVESLHLNKGKTLSIDKPYKELSTLHPADLAEILEGVDKKYRSKIFESLDEELAADTLEEMQEAEVQADIISGLSEIKAQEILEMIPNDEIADIIEELDEETKEKILSNLVTDDVREVTELLKYDDEDAGAIMAKEFLSFYENLTVKEAKEIIKDLDDEYDPEDIYYIFITNRDGILKGYISMSDLIQNEDVLKLDEIMNTHVEDINVTEHATTAVDLAIKYELLQIPVTDDDNKLVGVINIHDIIDEFLAPIWKKKN